MSETEESLMGGYVNIPDDYGYIHKVPWTPIIGHLLARARVWKQAAKKWREFALDLKAGDDDMAEYARDLEATATRRLGLLEEAEMDHIEGYAQFVDELAAELGDE
jgi:hypothetical protein